MTVAQRLVILLSLTRPEMTILSHWILETVKGVREIAKWAKCFLGKCKGLSSDLQKLHKAGNGIHVWFQHSFSEMVSGDGNVWKLQT